MNFSAGQARPRRAPMTNDNATISTDSKAMNRRRIMYLVGFAAAAAGPYAIFNGKVVPAVTNGWNSTSSEPAGNVALPANTEFNWPVSAGGDLSNGQPASVSGPLLAGPPVADLREVIRFDIDPAWVRSRWSRVSTTLANLELEGMRVPLVTGTAVDDLHGSLTFYFDRDRRLQRLSFFGYTGDARRLIELVTKYHHLVQQPTIDAGLYVRRWNNRPASVLRISHAPVVRASQPNSQLQVLLELNSTAGNFRLSEEVAALLELDKKAGRW